jgi:uncharacterized membrane protein YcaP (DUF421 family)
MFADVDWPRVFLPDTPFLELIVRGTLMYLGLFALLRVFCREAGTVSIPDLLVLVLIADAAQNAMSANYYAVTDGLVLVGTIIAWSYILNWVGYQVPAIRRVVHSPPLPLIENGDLLRNNMRRQFVTVDELMTHLREQGIEDVARVKRAYLEGDGRISVITFDEEHHPEDDRAAAP